MKPFLLLIVLSLSPAAAAFATPITNGDFESGDTTGWTASAIDGDGNDLDTSAFIDVVDEGSDQAVEFNTDELVEDLFIFTLEQSFAVEADKPVLEFDFASVLATLADPSGAGASPFFDSFVVSIDDGTETFELLLVDQDGAQTNPFGTADLFDISLETALNTLLDARLSVDLTAFVGQEITLFLDLVQEDDGARSSIRLDNFTTAILPVLAATAVPEPATWLLLGTGLLGVIAYRRRSA